MGPTTCESFDYGLSRSLCGAPADTSVSWVAVLSPTNSVMGGGGAWLLLFTASATCLGSESNAIGLELSNPWSAPMCLYNPLIPLECADRPVGDLGGRPPARKFWGRAFEAVTLMLMPVTLIDKIRDTYIFSKKYLHVLWVLVLNMMYSVIKINYSYFLNFKLTF